MKGRSFFAGRVGEEVAAGTVTLVDDPTDPRPFAATAYDGEGLACRRNVLIEDGRPARLPLRHGVGPAGRHARRRARRCGAGSPAPPAPAAGRSTLRPGDLDQDEILAAVGAGVYVQSVTGVHSGVNPVSGDFSVGVEGLMIRDGQLAEPVREVTVASTLQRMLQSVCTSAATSSGCPGSPPARPWPSATCS